MASVSFLRLVARFLIWEFTGFRFQQIFSSWCPQAQRPNSTRISRGVMACVSVCCLRGDGSGAGVKLFIRKFKIEKVLRHRSDTLSDVHAHQVISLPKVPGDFSAMQICSISSASSGGGILTSRLNYALTTYTPHHCTRSHSRSHRRC